HRIVRIDDLNGSGWVSYGSYGSGVGQFNFPRGIFIDRRDRIYVADTYNPRIVRIDDMNGSGLAPYGETTGTRMDYAPRNVTTDKFNRIYIAVAEADQVIRVDELTGKGRKVLQFKRDMTASKRPGTLGGPCSIVVVKPVEASNPIR